MQREYKKLSFKKIILLYKYTNSKTGDLARDILYDDNFPFRLSINKMEKYLEEQGLFSLCNFNELVDHYQNQEKFSPPPIENNYKQLFRRIDHQGKKCLDKDERDTIRSLWVPSEFYKNCASSIIEIPVKNSRKIHKEVLEVYAHYFRREFGYDLPLFSADEQFIKQDLITKKITENNFTGWLFTHRQKIYRDSIGMVKTIGGCCFRYREFSNVPPRWSLAWIWLHPNYRRRGILTSNWELFKEKFGENFYVEQPRSEAMRAFLSKVEHHY